MSPDPFVLAPTRFAPAERECDAVVRADHGLVQTAAVAGPILEALTDPMIVLNEFRQIVFANRRFLEVLHAHRPEDVLGVRLGEALGCVHANLEPSGCGTHEACRACAGVNSILRSLRGTAVVAQVGHIVEHAAHECAVCYQMHASPLTMSGRHFVLVALRNLRSETLK